MTTTLVSEPAPLQQLLAGLDVLDGLDLGDTSAQGQLAQHLVRQGQAQGVALTEREAQLVAKLVLAPAPSAMSRTDTPLTQAQVRGFFALPKPERTPAEREARWRRFCDPRRWGQAFLHTAGFGALSTGAWLILQKVAEWNWRTHFFQQSSAYEPIGLVVFACLAVPLLVGGLGVVISLAQAFWPQDAAIYHDRCKAVYRAQLDQLSALQLAQVLTGLQAESVRERTNLDAQLLPLVEAAMAARQSRAGA